MNVKTADIVQYVYASILCVSVLELRRYQFFFCINITIACAVVQIVYDNNIILRVRSRKNISYEFTIIFFYAGKKEKQKSKNAVCARY